MGINERREREKEQRRNAIVDAAEKIFFSKGLDKSTMDEVAEEAELSKGTLYLYFKNKEELYLAINKRGLQILEKLFAEASAKQSIGIEKVKAIGRAYFNFWREYPDYFNAMIYYESHVIDFSEDSACALACEEQGQKTLEVVAFAVQTGIEDGSIRNDLDPLKAAVVLWGQSTGIIQISSLKGAHFEEKHGINLDDVIELSFKMTQMALENK